MFGCSRKRLGRRIRSAIKRLDQVDASLIDSVALYAVSSFQCVAGASR